MPKLPEESMERLRDAEKKFALATGIEGFTFKAFEDKAEELDEDRPGKGYPLAYEETMNELFGKLLEAHVEHKENSASLRKFMNESDQLFQSYIQECEAQNIPPTFRTTDGELTDNFLKSFDLILYERNPTTIYEDVRKKFDQGEYTLTNARAYAQERKDTTPTKREALELIAQAKYLETRNQERNFLLKLILFPLHFMERNAIQALTELACKQGTYKDLVATATTKNPKIEALKEKIDDAFTVSDAKVETFLEKEDFQEIDDYVKQEMKIDQKGIDDKEFNRILEQIGHGANEDQLNETMDLGNGEADNGVSFDELLDSDAEIDASNAFEKVEFDEAEFDLFPKSGDLSKIEFEAPTKEQQASK